MANYLLITTLIFLLFAIIWLSSSFANVLIKVALIVLTVWGTYLLFGPANMIAQLAR